VRDPELGRPGAVYADRRDTVRPRRAAAGAGTQDIAVDLRLRSQPAAGPDSPAGRIHRAAAGAVPALRPAARPTPAVTAGRLLTTAKWFILGAATGGESYASRCDPTRPPAAPGRRVRLSLRLRAARSNGSGTRTAKR